MTKVIDLNDTLLKRGEQMFMTCTCGADDGFGAVVVQGKENPVVMCLICLACEKEYYLHYGEVTSSKTPDGESK